jgi:hypothetical protein
VFENRVLRRIFGPKRDEVAGECRKLHNEDLHDLYLEGITSGGVDCSNPDHVRGQWKDLLNAEINFRVI